MIRRAGPLVALAAVAVLVVLLGLGAVIGLGNGEGDGGPDATAAGTPASTVPTPATTAPVGPPTSAARETRDGNEVTLTPARRVAYGTAAPVLDRMPARSVLRITAIGFGELARGEIQQCTETGCANSFPVSFDEDGNARFQYLANDTVGRGSARCRADDPPCVVQLRSGDESAYVTTVFHDAAPAPRRVVVHQRRGGLVNGEPVLVSVTGFRPGERVQAMLCVAPDTYGPKRCGAPGPTAPFVVDADGAGRTAMVMHAGKVGTDGVACGRGTKCAVVVATARASVPAPAYPIAFAAGPSAQYDSTRLLIGLAIAVLLVALSVFLTRTTDWRKPTEADTPELDRATFADFADVAD